MAHLKQIFAFLNIEKTLFFSYWQKVGSLNNGANNNWNNFPQYFIIFLFPNLPHFPPKTTQSSFFLMDSCLNSNIRIYNNLKQNCTLQLTAYQKFSCSIFGWRMKMYFEYYLAFAIMHMFNLKIIGSYNQNRDIFICKERRQWGTSYFYRNKFSCVHFAWKGMMLG